jgi:hypothetical protein
MRKSRLLSLVLVLAMVISIFSACGRSTSGTGGDDSDSGTQKKTTAEKTSDSGDGSDSTDETTTKESDNSGDSTAETAGTTMASEKGQELTAFVTNYTEAKSATMDKMSKKLEDSGDMTLTMSMLGFALMDLTVAFVPMFDVVDATGIVPFLNIKNAFKKTKGNMITFGADYKVDEEQGTNTKGDRIFWDGKLDVKDESLSTIYYTERSGKKISNTIIEITKNKDGSYTSETISYSESDEGVGKVSGTFVSFEGEDMWLQMGEQESAKSDFDYVTVFNKKNVNINDLSKGFTLTSDISYVKGEIKSNLPK